MRTERKGSPFKELGIASLAVLGFLAVGVVWLSVETAKAMAGGLIDGGDHH